MESPAEQAAQRLARETTGWKTMEAKIHHDRTVTPSHPGQTRPPISGLDDLLIETGSGQRYLTDRVYLGGKLAGEMRGYCDGSKCATVTYTEAGKNGEAPRPRQVVISREFLHEVENKWNARPYPFRAYYAGTAPLYEVLPRARPMGKERVAGRECDLYLIENYQSGWGVHDLVYALDRETSVPLKETVYTAPNLHDSGRPVWVWEADSFDTVQGFHLAKASHYQQFQYKDGAPSLRIAEDLRVEEVSFNKTYDRATFWPELPPGTDVIDTTQRPVPPPRPPRAEAKASAVVPADSSVVAPPADWGARLSTVGLGLGLTLALVGVILWRRHPG